MERANTNLFKTDIESVVRETIDLVITKSRIYAIPVTIPCRIVHNRNSKNINVTLLIQSAQNKYKIVMKFHLQFAHTPSDKLIQLINSVGDQ